MSSLKTAIGYETPEKVRTEPTVYLEIRDSEPRRRGLSWTIRISVPDESDYILDVSGQPISGKRYRICKTRVENNSCTTTLRRVELGKVETRMARALEHVVNGFQSQELDEGKPSGVSMIWVTESVEKLKRIGMLCPKKDADKQINREINAMENQLKKERTEARL